MPVFGNQALSVVLANFKTKWRPGWNLTRFAPMGRNGLFLLVSSTSGKAQAREAIRGGYLGSGTLWTADWGGGWDHVELFTVGGKTFLFRLRSGDGSVVIQPVDGDRQPTDPVVSTRWSAGWDTVCVCPRGSATYLFLHKSGSGDLHIHRMNDDGTVGARTFDHAGGPWTLARSFTTTRGTFLFLLHSPSGRVRVVPLGDDGRPGTRVFNQDWSSGWDVAETFTVGTATFLFLLKPGTGDVHIHRLEPDGKVGQRVMDRRWTQGWDGATFYRFAGKTYLSLIRSATGDGHLHEMEPSGAVGQRVNPPEPFPRSWAEETLTTAGDGKGGLHDYFEDISRGRVGLKGSTVTPWVTVDASWEEVKERGRWGKTQAAVDAARAAGHSVSDDGTIVVYHSEPGDSGEVGGRVLGHPNITTLEFLAHEILHTWEMPHSHSDDESRASPWGNPLLWAEYDDPWDVMSASASHDANGDGPGLNVFNLGQMGWQHDNHLVDIAPNGSPTEVELHTLSRRLNRHRIGLRVHYGPGEFYSAEYRTRREWDRGLPADAALIHRIEPTPVFAGVPWKGTLDTGWDVLQPYTVGDRSFLLALQSAGAMEIRPVNDPGTIEEPVARATWTAGWSTVTTYRNGGGTFLLFLKAGTGDVHIHQMNDDGTVGRRVVDQRWSTGWTVARSYEAGGRTHLLLLKTGDGTVHIHRPATDGTPGPRTQTTRVSPGWDRAVVYRRRGRAFLLLYSNPSGKIEIRALGDDGRIGSVIGTDTWEPRALCLTAYGLHDTWILRAVPKPGGGTRLILRQMDDDGLPMNPGADIVSRLTRDWSAGWTHTLAFGTQGGLYLLIYKRGSGRTETVRLSRPRVLRRRREDDPRRGPVQLVEDADHGVRIEVLSTDPTAGTARFRIG